MGEIKLLPKNITDKIAAGEVVERPASIVKELVENAVDAKASAISISILGGGVKEIRVTDNGTGIFADDVNIAFEKHATSKIFTVSDLDYISTQGFRGEALSSVSAISAVEMKTKRKQEDMGTHIRVIGGRVDFINPAGLPDGTSVTVNSLFFNVPARRKFLKKDASEAAYVSDLVSRYILAFPEISFHYSSEGKSIYHSPGNGDIRMSIYCVYGKEVMDTIGYVEYQDKEIKVFGYVSRPGTVMRNRRAGSVFVNRRYVRNNALYEMVRSAYGETLVKGENPFFVLNIELPLSAVDVNVHPNKLQVRFKDAATVEYVIKEAVSQVCNEVRGSVNINKGDIPKVPNIEMRPAGEIQSQFFSGFATRVMKEDECAAPSQGYSYDRIDDELSVKSDVPDDNTNKTIETALYRLIGSFGSTYALVEQGDNLLIIDQHAAHERLLYERYKNNAANSSQTLLEPCVIRVSHEQKNLIDENLQIFASAGFDIQPFGILDYKISAVPSVAIGAAVQELMNDVIGEIQNGGDVVVKRDAIIKSACHHAVKAGDKLNEGELLSLVDSFLKTSVIPTCPHGRPVISIIAKKQIEKSFKRII